MNVFINIFTEEGIKLPKTLRCFSWQLVKNPEPLFTAF